MVFLDPEQSRHLLKVLRTVPGTEVRLTDGQGYYYRGLLKGKRRGRAMVQIREGWYDEGAGRPPLLVLACAMPKGKRFEWALEKSVELGVHQIWPLQTERTVIRPRVGKLDRWQNIMKSALKQTGRSLLPELKPVEGLRSCLSSLRDGQLFFGEAPQPDQSAGKGPPLPAGWQAASELVERAEPSEKKPPSWLAWLVGPEGGWSEEEQELVGAAGAVPVSLSPYRLRTETAALAGLVFLQAMRKKWVP
jgi:16S rRNA (uracil1498-N3)-methyltransferase